VSRRPPGRGEGLVRGGRDAVADLHITVFRPRDYPKVTTFGWNGRYLEDGEEGKKASSPKDIARLSDGQKGEIMTSVLRPAAPRGVHYPADTNDVLREQLQYLIAHAAANTACGCSECRRYLRVRSLLLEIFRSAPGFGHGIRAPE
jgi:hypothetical protein